jgi:hypothetical protein
MTARLDYWRGLALPATHAVRRADFHQVRPDLVRHRLVSLRRCRFARRQNYRISSSQSAARHVLTIIRGRPPPGLDAVPTFALSCCSPASPFWRLGVMRA